MPARIFTSLFSSVLLLIGFCLAGGALAPPAPPPAPPAWRFVDGNGHPVTAVSRVELVPLKLDHDIPIANENEQEELSARWRAFRQPDGSYTAPRAPAGAYRLLIDLYDRDVPSPPEFIFDLTPGMTIHTVTLPPPLLTVPAGTEISWLAKDSPAVFHRLVAGAWTETMPVYGPPDALLALWYPVQADKLALWQFVDGAIVKKELALRTVFLQPTDDDGKPYRGDFSIMPFFPTNWLYRTMPAGGNHLLLRSDEARLCLGPETSYRADLWTGQYLLTDTPPNVSVFDTAPPARRSLLTVPATGPATLTVPLLRREAPADKPLAARVIYIIFPHLDYKSTKEHATRFLTLTFDSRPGLDFLVARDAVDLRSSWSREINMPDDANVAKLDIPPDATRLSIRWLGYGEMRDIPILPAQPDKPTILILPDWQPGRTASLAVQALNGALEVNLKLQLVRRYAASPGGRGPELLIDEFYDGSHFGPPADEVLDVQTDTSGKLSLRGLPAGWQYLAVKHDGQTLDGWVLDVPEGGLPPMTLRRIAAPVIFPNGNGSQMWWIPEQGQPMQVRSGRLYNVPAGPGWFWSANTEQRYVFASYARLIAGQKLQALADAAPLGIIFPLTDNITLPGGVTLTGLDDRAGIVMQLPTLDWQVCPALRMVAGQVNGVPPGRYRVTVETPGGKVEAAVSVEIQGACLRLAFPKE